MEEKLHTDISNRSIANAKRMLADIADVVASVSKDAGSALKQAIEAHQGEFLKNSQAFPLLVVRLTNGWDEAEIKELRQRIEKCRKRKYFGKNNAMNN